MISDEIAMLHVQQFTICFIVFGKHSGQRQKPSPLYVIGSCGKSTSVYLEKIQNKATAILDALEWDQKPLCLNDEHPNAGLM